MKKILLILQLTVCTTFLMAQNETELLSIGYRSTDLAPLEGSKYDDLNDVQSVNQFYTFSLNYGHSLKDTTYSVLYGINYENVSQNVDLSMVNNTPEWDLLPKNYYQQPQYSQLSLSLGLNKTLRKDWSVSGIFYTNIVDDFFKQNLPTNVNLGGMAFLEKERGKHFSYGLGVLLVELESKLFTSAVLSLKYQGEKRGVEALIPVKLRLWQKINEKSYVEASVYNNFYSIEYQADNKVISTDILSFKPELIYNYIWGDFVKLSVGLDLPLREITITATDDEFKYRQYSLGFNIGLSLIIN